jgi:hypothetical protein
MQFWMIVLIARIVYEIAKRAGTTKVPVDTTATNVTIVADPATYAVRREYLYRM